MRNISIDSRQYIFSLRMNFNDNFADRELHHGANSVNLVEWILIESALFAEISRSSIHSHDLPTCSGLCIHPHGVQEAAPPVLVSRSLSILPSSRDIAKLAPRLVFLFSFPFVLGVVSSSSSSTSLPFALVNHASAALSSLIKRRAASLNSLRMNHLKVNFYSYRCIMVCIV